MSKTRNHFITIGLIGSGYAALHIAEYEDMDWMQDIVETGIGRYDNSVDAKIEAMGWAEAECLQLKIDNTIRVFKAVTKIT